jgi:hypothetical protein
VLAYIGKTVTGTYIPFFYDRELSPSDVEFSDDMFLITQETAGSYKHAQEASPSDPSKIVDTTYVLTEESVPAIAETLAPSTIEASPHPRVTKFTWTGDIPSQKWMNFYTKILSRFATERGLKLTLRVEVASDGGVSSQKIEETRSALRELGLRDDVDIS